MHRLVTSSLFLVGMIACGGDDGGTTPFDAPPENTPLCTAQLSITGTFTPTMTYQGSAGGSDGSTYTGIDPAGGCQPAGSWAIQVAVADKGNCTTVNVMAGYTYTVTGLARNTSVTNTNAVANEQDVLAFAGDNGICTGNFDQVTPDGTKFDEAELHPRLTSTGSGFSTVTITGDGDYNQYATLP